MDNKIVPLPFEKFNIGDRAYKKNSHEVYVFESIVPIPENLQRLTTLGVFTRQIDEKRFLFEFNEMSRVPPSSPESFLDSIKTLSEKVAKLPIPKGFMTEANEIFACFLECQELHKKGEDYAHTFERYINDRRAKEWEAIQTFISKELYNKTSYIKK